MEKAVEQKLDTFFSQFRTVQFQKEETIIHETDPIEYIYYLKKGFVRQFFITEEGEDITHHIFKPISYFPITLVLSNTSNQYVFEAMESLKLQKTPTERVLAFLKQEPDVLFDLTKRVSQGVNKLLTKQENMLFKDAYAKVVSLLVYLAQRFGETKDNTIVITLLLTHTDLASWLGMQRETVSRQIEKLQKKGLVCYKNNFLTISDIQKLRQEIG